jgi:NitT/TauT family transport system substrate-binding protein
VTKVGLGDVVDERFARGVSQQVEAAALPRAPAQAEVFNRSFLPARDQRLVK